MTLLFVFLGFALVLQIVLFFVIRARKKREKESNVLEKYDIRTSADAFKRMNDMSIPEEDRMEIERLYQGAEES